MSFFDLFTDIFGPNKEEFSKNIKITQDGNYEITLEKSFYKTVLFKLEILLIRKKLKTQI